MIKTKGLANDRGNIRGFTLVEVVLALALSTVTMSAIYQLYLSQVKNQAVRENILDMQQHTRAAMDLVTRELKMAGYDPGGVNRDALKGNNFFGVIFRENELTIQSDLNGDGAPDDANESIAFSHDPETLTLRRNTGGGRQPLGENIEEFSFRVFDREGELTTQSENICQVEVAITARTEKPDPQYPHNGGYRTFTLQTRVTPRNLHF